MPMGLASNVRRQRDRHLTQARRQGEKEAYKRQIKNRDHAFGLLEMSIEQTCKQGKHKKPEKTLPVACARPETQPGRWTRARLASNVGRLLQQRTTPWEAQTHKNLDGT